jgi:hypothetical protein
MYVSLADLGPALGLPFGKDGEFYTRHIHQLDAELGTRTAILVYWQNRLGVPMEKADLLLAAVNNRNASADCALQLAQRAGPGPVPPVSADKAELDRAGRITPGESVARVTAGLRKAGASEAMIAQYVARQDENMAGTW